MCSWWRNFSIVETLKYIIIWPNTDNYSLPQRGTVGDRNFPQDRSEQTRWTDTVFRLSSSSRERGGGSSEVMFVSVSFWDKPVIRALTDLSHSDYCFSEKRGWWENKETLFLIIIFYAYPWLLYHIFAFSSVPTLITAFLGMKTEFGI